MRSASLALAMMLQPLTALAEGELGTNGGPPQPPYTCTYFEHDNFGGAAQSLAFGTLRRYVGDGWNDRISSIACDPRCAFVAYEHRDFDGATKIFADGYNTLYVGDDWNDRISSVELFCEDPEPPPPPPAPAGNCTYGPDTCIQGFVWREAAPGDHVCVTPDIRARTQEENALAASRRQGFGAYGPNTCFQGFVWREAFPGDVVCVPPDSRSQASADNAQAAARDACGG